MVERTIHKSSVEYLKEDWDVGKLYYYLRCRKCDSELAGVKEEYANMYGLQMEEMAYQCPICECTTESYVFLSIGKK